MRKLRSDGRPRTRLAPYVLEALASDAERLAVANQISVSQIVETALTAYLPRLAAATERRDRDRRAAAC